MPKVRLILYGFHVYSSKWFLQIELCTSLTSLYTTQKLTTWCPLDRCLLTRLNCLQCLCRFMGLKSVLKLVYILYVSLIQINFAAHLTALFWIFLSHFLLCRGRILILLRLVPHFGLIPIFLLFLLILLLEA